MRIIESTRDHFHGTHKGAEIRIERDEEFPVTPFYILVHARNGGLLYDGWCPEGIKTMAEAKREAVRGACLDKREGS